MIGQNTSAVATSSSVLLTTDHLHTAEQFPRFLNPGGVLELMDIIYPMASDDGSLIPGCPLDEWSRTLNEGFAGIGRSMSTALKYSEQLAEAGFVDVVEVRKKWPTNRWPKDSRYKQIGEKRRALYC